MGVGRGGRGGFRDLHSVLKMTGEVSERKIGAAVSAAVSFPLFGLAAAYGYFEWFLGLHPCTLCWWQRWAQFGALGFGVLGLSAWKFGARKTAAVSTGLAGAALFVSASLALWHVLTETGVVAVSVCASRGEQDFAAVLERPVVRCDVAPWSFAGVSIAGWNLIYSLAGAVLIFGLLLRGRRHRRRHRRRVAEAAD